ncbi:304_t:CDS:2 [Funneliformis geosporum]|uniref:304_t:CDS:1 n=1 Tax=Funneliformis geosporum TaxID=1117311 RepID=A0A9W4SQM3_9GLOM|nr:304_t:CDS:2 [Funneliformis geosporum]
MELYIGSPVTYISEDVLNAFGVSAIRPNDKIPVEINNIRNFANDFTFQWNKSYWNGIYYLI